MSRGELLGFLGRKKRLKSKDFFELYDVLWQGTAPVRYRNPDHALRECLEMIRKQYGGPPF